MYFTVFIPLSWSSFTFISSIKIEKKIGHKCAKDYVPFALYKNRYCESSSLFIRILYREFLHTQLFDCRCRISNTKYDTIHTEHEHDTK